MGAHSSLAMEREERGAIQVLWACASGATKHSAQIIGRQIAARHSLFKNLRVGS